MAGTMSWRLEIFQLACKQEVDSNLIRVAKSRMIWGSRAWFCLSSYPIVFLHKRHARLDGRARNMQHTVAIDFNHSNDDGNTYGKNDSDDDSDADGDDAYACGRLCGHSSCSEDLGFDSCAE